MRASRDGRDDAGRVDAVVAGGRGRVVVVVDVRGLGRRLLVRLLRVVDEDRLAAERAGRVDGEPLVDAVDVEEVLAGQHAELVALLVVGDAHGAAGVLALEQLHVLAVGDRREPREVALRRAAARHGVVERREQADHAGQAEAEDGYHGDGEDAGQTNLAVLDDEHDDVRDVDGALARLGAAVVGAAEEPHVPDDEPDERERVERVPRVRDHDQIAAPRRAVRVRRRPRREAPPEAGDDGRRREPQAVEEAPDAPLRARGGVADVEIRVPLEEEDAREHDDLRQVHEARAVE
mmetsp:Transcript_24268/g.78463  ORF Transcript_24268/g.78463 Transcript_24268/m.78463 type:complete len:292 (-) Transcript_24268:340-1215(-)